MPEKIKTLYGSLIEEGYDLPNYDQFLKDMSDNNKRTKFHASLVEEGYELPDFKTFSIDMGFDEKKKGFQTDLGKAYENTSGGSFPKYQGTPLVGSTPMTKMAPKQPSLPSNVNKDTFQKEKQKLSKESPIVKIKSYEGALNIVNQRFNQNLELFNQAKQAGDEQAMAQLQPLLQIDSKKAEGLKKGIEAQKFEANFTEADDIANNFNIGVYRAMGTMMQGPKAFDESVAVILADVAGIPQESVKAYMENVYPATSSASDKLASAGKFVNKIAEERGQEKNLNRSYGGSAYEALLKGDVKTSANYAFKDFVQSFPSSMTYVNPATATLSSLGMVGEELQAAKNRGEQIDSKTVLAGGIKAGLEIATERWLGGTKSAAKLLNSLGKEGAEQAIRQGVEQLAKKSLGRKWIEATGEEVVGESINQLGSNAVDIYLNGNKEKSLFEGVGDAALISVFGGGVQTGLSETANHYLDKAKYNKAQAMREEAASLTEQAMDQPNEVAAQALEEKAAEIQAQADEIEQKESELAINASTETVDAIMEKEAQIDELSAAIEVATPETAPILEDKLNALEEERVALVEQATLEANEAIKALESIKEPIQEDETITTKEEDVQPMLEGIQTNRDENQAGETSPKLRTEQTQEEVVVQEEPADISSFIEKSTKKELINSIKSGEIIDALNKEGGTNVLEFFRKLEEFQIPLPMDIFKKLEGESLADEMGDMTEDELDELQQLIQNATERAGTPLTIDTEAEVVEEPAKEEIEVIKEESTKSSKPSESDKNYEESQEVNRIVSKENPNASVLIQPKGNDLVLTAIYVGKEKRGGGIGTKVLESVKEQAKKVGKKVVLDATNELDQETDLVRLGNFYEKNGFKKVGENKYEYDPKAEVSSGDIGTRNNDTGPKESDITAGSNKGEPSENVNVSTKEEPQVETEKPILAESTPSENITNKQNKNENTNEKTDEGSRIQKDGEKGNEVVTEGVQNAREKGRQDVNQQEQEELLTNKQQDDAVKKRNQSKDNQQQYKGTAEQQQGEQEDRTNKEEPITTSQEEAGNRGGSKQSREIEEEVALTPDEEVITEEIKITKNEAKRAKSASTKRTRKSKDVAKVIENQAKDVEDSGDVEGARDIIESVETAEAAILNNTPVLNNFKDKYDIDEVELANEFNLMDKKNADLKTAYEVISGNKFDGNINVFTKDFLEAISANGIKLKNKVSFEIEDGVNNEILVLPLPIKSKGKSGIDSLETIVLKDALRPVMQSVYFEDNNLIATNGHVLIVLPQKQTDSEIKDILADKYFKSLKKVIPTYTKKQAIEYIDKNTEGGLKGKIFDAKTGEFVDGIYPKYKAVIPQNFDNETQPESIDNLISIANGGVFLAKNNTSDIFAINLGDKGSQYTYQPQLFLNILQAMQSNGAKKVILKSSEKAGRPLVLESDNGIIGLIMPIQVKEESLVSQGFNIIESKKSITDSIIAALENIKADTKGKMNAFGIIPAIWNAGVDTIILAVKAGKSISEAIQEGINYFKENGAKFDEAEVTDFFNKLLSPKKEAPKVEQETPKEEPKKEKVEEPKSKTSKFFETISNNKSLEEANKVLSDDIFEYIPKSQDESRKKAKAYIDKVGVEDALENFLSNSVEGLELDEEVALASLLTIIINMGIERNIQEGNLEGRDVLEKKYQQLIEAARNRFTKLGQAVNAIKLFLESMSSPELAAYRLENSVRKANEEIKKKPSVKTNASTRVNSGKKTINEGVKTAAEEVAQELNNELYGVITKGKKGLTESQKKNVKAFFNKLKIDTKNAAFSTIIPIPPKLYNDFVEAVGNLVVEGVSLSVAMTQVSTEFIKNKIASPDELAQARKILSEEVNGLKEKKPLTEAQKQRNAAREELRKATAEYKELEKLAKELEKEKERVEKLRKEEAKKQSERIDKATNELLAAERKEAEKNAKELEKKIKELTKEISQGKALQDQVEDIINEYLKMGAMDNTANKALIDLVKERLGITDEKQAVDVATKIAKSVVTNIREKLSKKWDADIKRQREKETKEEKVKDPHKEVNDFVKGVALGSMDAEQFIELFGAKYGLETLTEQDFAKVKELAAKVRDAETKHRKAKALNDMVQYINSKAPVTLSQLFDELWYFKVLSPALTFLLGTADTNLTYNFTQVYNTIFELPIQQLITALKNKAEIAKDKKGLKKAEFILADAIRNIAMGYAKAVIQRGNIKNVDINANTFLNVIKTEGFLKDSITYFKEIMTEGSGAFQEYESPFKAGAKTEFEIRRWFKLAKNGDVQAKRDIVNAMLNSGADVLNLLVKSVPRSLAAGDLFFSAIIKNAYLPALVREYLIKNTDLRGAALNNEVSRILLNTDVELENAKQRAVENRMRLDIEIKPKMVGDKIVYEIYDKGKLVKGQIFDTKEEANEYARRVVAPKSPMYEMDVTDYLNVKIPAQAMLGANRLAGQAILGGSPPGMSGQLLKGFNYLNDIIGKGTTGLEDVSKSLMLKGEDSNLKYILTPTALTAKTLAVVISGLSRLMAFRRVGIMLARNYSNYVPPIGLLRYGMSYAGKSALFIDYLPDQIPSDVERDRMLAQVALGTFVTAVSVTSILALKGLMDDDDDKDERIAKAIKNIQEGTLVGSLSDILTKDQIAAYKASGDIQEFSIYLGLDKNGKRKWRSVKPDPSYSSALILATYAWNDIINKDDSALKSAGLGLASFYNQIKEMGIGQGLPKLSNARSIGEFADIVAQTAFFDNLEITKIGLVTKLTQYLDRKKRLDPHWMDYVEDSNSYLQGTANYVLNEAIPFYNLGDAVRQPLSYGALGEEMYRTPSSEQGYISASISYLDSGKNKETRNMYRWLASNGYDKMFYANVTDLKDADGNDIKLSVFEKNKLGMLAAKASYLELKKKKADLEVIRQTGGTKAFRTEVEKIFRSNFNDVVQLVKKKMAPDAVQYEREKNNIEFNNKVEKLKADNEGLFELIDGIKSEISNAEVKLVPFEEMDTFGTALKEAKSSDKWNMITSNLNMLKGKYDKVALEQYLIYLEDLGYLQPELGKDAYNYLMGEKPE